MNEQDKKQFAETLAIAAEATGFQISDSTYKTYWALLKDLELNQFQQAVNAHLLDPEQGMFFPKPANIMRHITGTAKEQQQSLVSQAELAWQAVEGEIRRTGRYGSPKIDDGLALAAIKGMGGWSHLCGLNTDKLTWARKEFISTYQNYSTTPIELLPKSLPGLIDIENAKRENPNGLKHIADISKKLGLKNEDNK